MVNSLNHVVPHIVPMSPCTPWFCLIFLSASDAHWPVLVSFRLYWYDCCWPGYQPVGNMCLKIAAFRVKRINIKLKWCILYAVWCDATKHLSSLWCSIAIKHAAHKDYDIHITTRYDADQLQGIKLSSNNLHNSLQIMRSTLVNNNAYAMEAHRFV